jgi:hypothetical protein
MGKRWRRSLVKETPERLGVVNSGVSDGEPAALESDAPLAGPQQAGELQASPELPELWWLGVAPARGGWLVYRVSSRGAVEVLTPKRRGEYVGESKHAAVARLMDAQWTALAARGGPAVSL